METLDIGEAVARTEQRLDVDRAKVTQSVALRAAQVKHLVNRLRAQAEQVNDAEVREKVETLTPPMSGDKLIPFALESHARYSEQILPFLRARGFAKGAVGATTVESWLSELEEVLLEIRRIVMQNLSKHPAMKPYQMLADVEERAHQLAQLERTAQQHFADAERAQNETQAFQTALANMRNEPGFETLVRLEESRDTLLRQKREMGDAWMQTWSRVEPVLRVLNEKTKTFAGMENAQLRVYQLYTANPATARGRDVHAAGLLMILRLAVSALEEKKSGLTKGEKEPMRETLLEAIENPFFVRFQEMTREWEMALEANHREYYSHPLYERRATLERGLQEWENVARHSYTQGERMAGEVMQGRDTLARQMKEADELCRLNLGFGVRFNA